MCINMGNMKNRKYATKKPITTRSTPSVEAMLSTQPIKFDYVYRNRDDAGTILHEVVTLDEIQTDEFVYELEILARRLFTGRQDMMGVDIFDGDILEYVSPFEDEEPRDTYVVEWRGHGFFAAWIRNGVPQYRGMDGLVDADKDMRVIGNVIQHQHLLTGNQTS